MQTKLSHALKVLTELNPKCQRLQDLQNFQQAEDEHLFMLLDALAAEGGNILSCTEGLKAAITTAYDKMVYMRTQPQYLLASLECLPPHTNPGTFQGLKALTSPNDSLFRHPTIKNKDGTKSHLIYVLGAQVADMSAASVIRITLVD
jgi:hypothetical protein